MLCVCVLDIETAFLVRHRRNMITGYVRFSDWIYDGFYFLLDELRFYDKNLNPIVIVNVFMFVSAVVIVSVPSVPPRTLFIVPLRPHSGPPGYL